MKITIYEIKQPAWETEARYGEQNSFTGSVSTMHAVSRGDRDEVR